MKRCAFILAILAITTTSCKKSRQSDELKSVNQKEILKEFTFLGRALGLAKIELTSERDGKKEYQITAYPVGLIIGDSGRQVTLNLHNVRLRYQKKSNGDEAVELANEIGLIASLKFGSNHVKGRLQIHRRGALKYGPSTGQTNGLEKLSSNNLGLNVDDEFDLNEDLDLLTTEELELLIVVSALHAELTNTHIVRFEEEFGANLDEAILMGRPCRWTVINIGGTEGMSEDRTAREVKRFLGRHPDCRTVLTPTTGCFWGKYYCVTTQELECMQYCPFK